MLEWFKKEDGAAELTPEKTNNLSGADEEVLAVISNKKIKKGISKVPVTIGKNPSAADISFFHPSVDNVHCTIDCINGQFIVKDNGSKEGTQINGQRLHPDFPYKVNDGDSLVIGKVAFEFNVNAEEMKKREEARLAAEASKKPAEKTYQIKARPVMKIEYDEAEVVYISCGLEPEKKKAAYTQEIKTEQIREALRAAEEKKAAVPSPVPAPAPTTAPAPAQAPMHSYAQPAAPAFMPARDAERVMPAFVPEPDVEPVMPKQAGPIEIAIPASAAASSMSLTCIKGFGIGEEVKVDHFPFRIGRSKTNDYILKIDKISREHACLTERNGMYYITDTNSTNGIKVNGIRIDKAAEYRISEGDTITLSDNVYRVGFPGKR